MRIFRNKFDIHTAFRSCNIALTLAKKEVDRLTELRDQSEVVSPTFGTVGVFRVRSGRTVRQGEPLVEILDRAQEYVTVMVRSRDLPKFEMGMEVAVIFPGEIKRHGLVSEIPPQVSEVREDGQSYSELKITATDKSWPDLPFGSNVEVSLSLIDRRHVLHLSFRS